MECPRGSPHRSITCAFSGFGDSCASALSHCGEIYTLSAVVLFGTPKRFDFSLLERYGIPVEEERVAYPLLWPAHVCESGRGNNPNRGAARPEGSANGPGGTIRHRAGRAAVPLRRSCGSQGRLVTRRSDSLGEHFPLPARIAHAKPLRPLLPRFSKHAVHVE